MRVSTWPGVLVFALLAAAPAPAATIEVDTEEDTAIAGECSLRDAVTAANTNGPVRGCEKGQASKRDTILMRIRGFHVLSAPTTDEAGNLNGDLDVADGGPVTIKGAKDDSGLPRPTGLLAPDDDRAFDVLPGADLTVERLEIVTEAFQAEVAAGGHFRVNDAKLTLKGTEVQDAQAAVGGGIAAFGSSTVSLDRSILISNEAILGGGLSLAGEAVGILRRSTVMDNVVEAPPSADALGGGVLNRGSLLTIDKSTFDGNLASAGGSGEALGGAVMAEAGTRVTNSTFFENGADLGAGIAGQSAIAHSTFAENLSENGSITLTPRDGTISVRNSIVAGAFFDSLCAGDSPVVSKDYNVFTASSAGCGLVEHDAGAFPIGLADQPEDNGGPNRTLAIQKDSVAKDYVPLRKCSSANGVDQRGFGRPAGKRCDSGAYEKGGKP